MCESTSRSGSPGMLPAPRESGGACLSRCRRSPSRRPAVAGAQTAAEWSARRYAPIVAHKENPDPPCSRKGEQYRLAPVGITLGNPDVQLVRLRSGGSFSQSNELATAPTARISPGSGPTTTSTSPPSPPAALCLRPRLGPAHEGALFGHLRAHRHGPGVRGIAVQYLVLLLVQPVQRPARERLGDDPGRLDATTVEEALADGPSQLAYAQHQGGERRAGTKLGRGKRGTHPVVYASSGSHASQYWSALFLGNGRRGSGLGCDDTRAPSTRAAPRPVLVPTRPAFDPLCLARVRGPLGPARAWRLQRPDGAEHEAPVAGAVPLDGRAAHVVTDRAQRRDARGARYRRLLRRGQLALEPPNDTSSSPLTLLYVFATIAVAIGILAPGTRWRPVVAAPLRQRRAGGQIVDAAARVYWEHLRVLAPVGLIAVPLGALAVAGQALLFHSTGLRVLSMRSRTTRRRASSPCWSGCWRTRSRLSSSAQPSCSCSGFHRDGKVHLRVVLKGLDGELWRLVGLALEPCSWSSCLRRP